MSLSAKSGHSPGEIHSAKRPINVTGAPFLRVAPRPLIFSLGAHFDPSTTLEALIENTRTNWLIERYGDALAGIAHGPMHSMPKEAWRFVPLAAECVGNEGPLAARLLREISRNHA